MELREIDYTENLPETLCVLHGPGLLLATVGADGVPNVMTIGWASPGIIWGRRMMVVYVRPSRYTFEKLAEVGEFVVNVPDDEMEDTCIFCGTKSGREVDKFAECGLTALPAEQVRAPLIAQCVRFYECRVIHTGDFRDSELTDEVRRDLYPSGNLHRVYYGQILRAAERV
jgi:flavin reductase (DIM6/NTAB) family NADH-FMN oxidoreductase RutF